MGYYKHTFYLLFFIAALVFAGFWRYGDRDPAIMTIAGPVSAEETGIALTHEHVLVDWIGADSTGYHRWNRPEVVERVLPFLSGAKEKGVKIFAEFTPAYLGRDPFLLKELSQKTGLHFITNTGYYGAVENRFMPAHARRESAGEIAERWTEEFIHGIDGSGVRPGFMKISVAEEVPLSPLHRNIVEAAALTHLETGMTIFSHTIGDVPARAQVDLLQSIGVAPSAWVWTHAQSGSMEAVTELAEKGAWIALDGIRFNPDREPGERGSLEWYAGRLSELRDKGLLDRVLISHDAGWYEAGKAVGGDYHGYTDIFDHLLPLLSEYGFTKEEFRQLLEVNPAQAFALRVRTPR